MIYEPDIEYNMEEIIKVLEVERKSDSSWNVKCNFDKLNNLNLNKNPKIVWFIHELIRCLNVTGIVYITHGKICIILNRIVFYKN